MRALWPQSTHKFIPTILGQYSNFSAFYNRMLVVHCHDIFPTDTKSAALGIYCIGDAVCSKFLITHVTVSKISLYNTTKPAP